MTNSFHKSLMAGFTAALVGLTFVAAPASAGPVQAPTVTLAADTVANDAEIIKVGGKKHFKFKHGGFKFKKFGHRKGFGHKKVFIHKGHKPVYHFGHKKHHAKKFKHYSFKKRYGY